MKTAWFSNEKRFPTISRTMRRAGTGRAEFGSDSFPVEQRARRRSAPAVLRGLSALAAGRLSQYRW